jgi:NAD(P)-dependent dehydrogenase (short-subunit alcohol dehydrogenase family)
MPTALVTGASRGIGRGIALALAHEGFDLVINYAKNIDAAREVESQITKLARRAHLVQADVSVREDRQELLDETLRAFGAIDLLVNNAGVAPDVRADLLEATEASFDRLININLKGPFFLTQLVAKQMIAQKGSGVRVQGSGNESASSSQNPEPSTLNPKIITITSISAYTASVNRGDYCVAKAGLAMMTQLFAARLAEHNINVYEIRPGVIETDMTGPVKAKYDDLIFNKDLTPLKRWGQPEDIARAVVAIAKDLLPFSTGEVLNIDGGFHLRRL